MSRRLGLHDISHHHCTLAVRYGRWQHQRKCNSVKPAHAGGGNGDALAQGGRAEGGGASWRLVLHAQRLRLVSHLPVVHGAARQPLVVKWLAVGADGPESGQVLLCGRHAAPVVCFLNVAQLLYAQLGLNARHAAVRRRRAFHGVGHAAGCHAGPRGRCAGGTSGSTLGRTCAACNFMPCQSALKVNFIAENTKLQGMEPVAARNGHGSYTVCAIAMHCCNFLITARQPSGLEKNVIDTMQNHAENSCMQSGSAVLCASTMAAAGREQPEAELKPGTYHRSQYRQQLASMSQAGCPACHGCRPATRPFFPVC